MVSKVARLLRALGLVLASIGEYLGIHIARLADWTDRMEGLEMGEYCTEYGGMSTSTEHLRSAVSAERRHRGSGTVKKTPPLHSRLRLPYKASDIGPVTRDRRSRVVDLYTIKTPDERYLTEHMWRKPSTN